MAFDSFYELWFAAVWSAARQNPACGAAESATAYALQKAVTDRLQARWCRSRCSGSRQWW